MAAHPAETGTLSRGPTLADVARLAGVSMMTVSRVANDCPNVRRATRERVGEAIRRLNYVPNTEARALATARRRRVALCHSTARTPYIGEILTAALKQSSESGVQLFVVDFDDDEDAAVAAARVTMSGVDAVLLCWPFCDVPAVREVIAAAALPCAALAPGRGTGDLTVDDQAAARAMTEHLLRLGHGRIAFIGGDLAEAASHSCLAGYRAAMASAGLSAAASVLMGHGDYRTGLDAAAELLARPTPPTAIFASSDEIAAAIVATAHGRELDVPADLTVCGFGDSAIGRAIWPRLTTSCPPVAELTRQTVSLLVRRARRGTAGIPSAQTALHYRIVRRQSDAAPRLFNHGTMP